MNEDVRIKNSAGKLELFGILDCIRCNTKTKIKIIYGGDNGEDFGLKKYSCRECREGYLISTRVDVQCFEIPDFLREESE